VTLKARPERGGKGFERVNEGQHFRIIECQGRRSHCAVDDVPGDADSCSINASIYSAD
jgi:hypothetical protein